MLHLPLEPHPNESTTPVLNPRGARRAALGSGPLGAWPCAFQLFGLSKVTHKYGSDAQARARVIELAFPVNVVGANVGAKYLY